jgi:predicted transcriptional regulator
MALNNDSLHAVRDIMRPAVCVHTDDTLEEILGKMMLDRRNSLVVVDDAGTLAGVVNAIDIIKAVLPNYLEDDLVAARFASEALLKESAERARHTPVSKFMTTDTPTIEDADGILEATSLAVQSGRGRIVVVDANGVPVGVVTRTEIKQVIGALLGLPGAFA